MVGRRRLARGERRWLRQSAAAAAAVVLLEWALNMKGKGSRERGGCGKKNVNFPLLLQSMGFDNLQIISMYYVQCAIAY